MVKILLFFSSTCENDAARAIYSFGVIDEIKQNEEFMNLVRKWEEFKGISNVKAIFTREKKT